MLHWGGNNTLPIKSTTPDHNGDVVKSPLRSEWYDSIFQTMKNWKNLQHSVHRFYILYYHQIQRYSDPEYLLGLKRLTLTINTIYTKELVQMNHTLLKELTSLYHIHM